MRHRQLLGKPENRAAVLAAVADHAQGRGMAITPGARRIESELLLQAYTFDLAVAAMPAAAGSPPGFVLVVADGSAVAPQDNVVSWVLGLERHLAAFPVDGFDIR